MTIMEVCGTHTAAIARSGLKTLLPQNIRLVSGPGCPVCVTDAGFIDGVISFARQNNAEVLCFGDMTRVRGTERSFAEARAEGMSLTVIYSPRDAATLAQNNPERLFLLAATGFETTAPLYALSLATVIREGIKNLKFAFALKTMIPAMQYICETAPPDGFICPGHVAAIIGANAFNSLEKYGKPLIIAGFEPKNIAAAIARITKNIGRGVTENLYKSAVSDMGNQTAQNLLAQYFDPCDAHWRGIGEIVGSGLKIKPEFAEHAIPITRIGAKPPQGCRCADVLLGRIDPRECALFGKACTPENPVGACMVSAEGACGIYARQGEIFNVRYK